VERAETEALGLTSTLAAAVVRVVIHPMGVLVEMVEQAQVQQELPEPPTVRPEALERLEWVRLVQLQVVVVRSEQWHP
jgi:hypothetical protein